MEGFILASLNDNFPDLVKQSNILKMNDHDQQVSTGLRSGGAIAQNRFDRRQHEDPTQTCISSSMASFSSSSQLVLILKLIKSEIPNCEILQSQLSV